MPTPTPRVSVRTRRVAMVTLSVITFSLVIAASIVTYQRRQPPVQTINYSQLYTFAETGGAIALQVEGETLTVTRSDGSRQAMLRVNPEVARALRGPERAVLNEIEDYLGSVDVTSDPRVHQEQFDFAFA